MRQVKDGHDRYLLCKEIDHPPGGPVGIGEEWEVLGGASPA
jgi:hypothetical protein